MTFLDPHLPYMMPLAKPKVAMIAIVNHLNIKELNPQTTGAADYETFKYFSSNILASLMLARYKVISANTMNLFKCTVYYISLETNRSSQTLVILPQLVFNSQG